MYFYLGLLGSTISGLYSVLTKKTLAEVGVKQYQLIFSFISLILSFPLYNLILGLPFNFKALYTTSFSVTLLMIFYFILRIVSNISHFTLLEDKESDVNVITILVSMSSFVSIGLNFYIEKYFLPIVLLSLIVSVVGAILTTIDFKTMKFKLSKKSSIYILLCLFAMGTKPIMANSLLKTFDAQTLCFFEYLNYFCMYLIIYRKEIFKIKLNRKNLVNILINTVLAMVVAYISYIMFNSIILSIITSIFGTVSVAFFSVIILKTKLSKQNVIGIIFITLGIIIAKF